MKRYRFRLAQVLRVRRIQEDQARAGVAAAQAEVRRREAALADALDRYRAVGGAGGALQTAAWSVERARADASARSVVSAGVAVRVAKAAVTHAVAVWQDAAAAVQALERLDDRRRAEHALEALREDDKAVDDQVLSRRALALAEVGA